MKKWLFLLILLFPLNLIFGQNDSLVDNKTDSEYRFSFGIDAFFGPASGLLRVPHSTTENIGYYAYGSVRLNNHRILLGLIVGSKITAEYGSQGNQMPQITFQDEYPTITGLTLGYVYKPSNNFKWFSIEYKFNVYQEKYIVRTQQAIQDYNGTWWYKYMGTTETVATVINNSLGIGFHTPSDKRLEFYGQYL